MQKVSYMGDGATTEFTFNFPYFENTDVVVTKNGAAATGYNIIGTSGGLDADIPYVGGKVVFETAPTALDCITIGRNLPMQRQYDYQPLVKIDPTTLNQDINYLIELLKDLQDELDELHAQYADIADKESTTTLLARISAIHEEIVAVNAQIIALGDISTLRQSVTTNTGDIASLKDASNFTATGRSVIGHMAMPSDRYDTLTLGASGANYTAPADGYVALGVTFDTNGAFVAITADSMSVFGRHYNTSSWETRLCLPVAKGHQFQINYSGVASIGYFRFIYIDGSK